MVIRQDPLRQGLCYRTARACRCHGERLPDRHV